MSSVKWRPFCLGLNVLNTFSWTRSNNPYIDIDKHFFFYIMYSIKSNYGSVCKQKHGYFKYAKKFKCILIWRQLISIAQ